MALLDAFDTEQGRLGLGLLAMAQPSRMSDGERMLGALQMLDQFKAQRSAAEERKADREERARVRMLQEQQIQMQIEAAKRQQAREGAADAYRASLIPGGDGMGPTRPFDPLTAAMVLPPDQAEALFRIESERRKAQQQDQIQNAIRRAVSPVQPIEANAASGIPGPRPQALGAVGQRRPIDFQQLIAMGVPESMVKALAEAPNYGRPEVARTIEVDDGKGGKATRRESRFGEVIGEDLPAYIAPTQVNLGDRVAFATPKAGLSLRVNMSPSERDASARGWADIGVKRSAEARAAQGSDDWQFDPTRGVQINKRTGQWRPVVSQDGAQPLEAKGTNAQQAADKALESYRVIEQMLNHPGLNTAIGLSGQIDPRNYVWGSDAQGARALIEQVQGQAFLQAFESLKGGGQITQIEGEKATGAIARLQRAQSDEDFKAAARELQEVTKSAYERATGKPFPVPRLNLNTLSTDKQIIDAADQIIRGSLNGKR